MPEERSALFLIWILSSSRRIGPIFLAQQAFLQHLIWAGAKHPAGSVWGVYIAARLVFIRPGGRVRVCNASLDGVSIETKAQNRCCATDISCFWTKDVTFSRYPLALSHFFWPHWCILYTRHKHVPFEGGVIMSKITNKADQNRRNNPGPARGAVRQARQHHLL